MKKQKDDMQVNVAGLRRNIKNLAHNYSDAQVKVREATSNDPWGPSATIMAEIADLTYNVVAFSEIMQMIWKRLNDHGKNWRHVYKALILLEYLIKTGTEKVAQQCKENIFAIQTLREFVYFEEGKDQGTHVREKAKQLVHLLKDDERLKNERVKALKAKERFAQHASGFGSDGYIEGPTHRDAPPGWQEEPKPVSELEMVRPQTAGEEELQLQLAMAMSREEAEQEEAKRRSDDVRLQLALSQSEQDFKVPPVKEEPQSHLLDLLDISLGATSISSPPLGAAGGSSDPWGTPARAASQLSDPWSGTSSPQIDPWQPAAMKSTAPPLGAVGGSEAWLSQRTQSPSVASGSSNEGWLQPNNLLTNGTMNGNSTSGDPWITKTTTASVLAPAPTSRTPLDPWLGDSAKASSASTTATPKPEPSLGLDDPWAPKLGEATAPDAWKSLTKKTSPDMDEFDIITNRSKTGDLLSTDITVSSNNNNHALLDELDPLSSSMSSSTGTTKKPLKTPQAFLGENSALVNLDNLIKPVVPQSTAGNAAYNPFSDSVIPPKTNLFQQQQPAVPSINQLKQQQPFTMTTNQDPWAPVNNTAATSQLPDNYLIDYDSDQITVEYTSKPIKETAITNINTLSHSAGNNNIGDQEVNYDIFNTNSTTLNRSIRTNQDYNNYNNYYIPQSYNNGVINTTNMSNDNLSYECSNSHLMHSEFLSTTTNLNFVQPNNNKNQNMGSGLNSYSNALSASLADTPGVTISAVNPSGGTLFSYGFYDATLGGTAFNCKAENNNNMPWMKPEAAASNPFLS